MNIIGSQPEVSKQNIECELNSSVNSIKYYYPNDKIILI